MTPFGGADLEAVVDNEVSAHHVVVLTTGGTIATTGGASAPGEPPSVPTRSGVDLLTVAEAFGPLPDVDVVEVANTASWALDLDGMLRVVHAVTDVVRRDTADGIVVTHGTTTLEFTAFLSDLVVPGPVPVVFTGAMRRADVSDTDGPRNLYDSLWAAASPQTRQFGTLVCFDGRLFAARDAYKQHRSAVGSFTAFAGGELGTVEDGVVDVRFTGRERPLFEPKLDPRVAVVKAYPGAGRGVLDAAVAEGARGIVLEGLPGAGGVPEPMLPGLQDAVNAGVVVVVSSAAPHGAVPDPPTGGTGEVLLALDLVSARRLRTEKAWVQLAVALAAEEGTDGVRQEFRSLGRTEATVMSAAHGLRALKRTAAPYLRPGRPTRGVERHHPSGLARNWSDESGRVRLRSGRLRG